MQSEMQHVPTNCDHNRTVIIARRDGIDYVECLDCRLIIEAEDLEPVVTDDEAHAQGWRTQWSSAAGPQLISARMYRRLRRMS